ncbi:MAG: hypothetical protein ACOC8E_07610 [Planctomycetota bacterium]
MAEPDYEDDTACCPKCGAEVHLYANRCPHCGDYITPTLRRKGSRLWVAVVAVIALAAFLWLLLGP